MLYISKGVLSHQAGNTLSVSYCGAQYALTEDQVFVWEKGRCGYQGELSTKQLAALNEIRRFGIIEMGSDTKQASMFRLLVNCVICSVKHKSIFPLWHNTEQLLLRWIRGAGLRLTIAELVFLIENKINPSKNLLGESNRQAITEIIYNAETIADGALDSLIEKSPACEITVQAVLELLHKNTVYLI